MKSKTFLIDEVREEARGLWLQVYYGLTPQVRGGLDGDKILCPICTVSLLRIDLENLDGKTYCACGMRRGFDFVMAVNDWSLEETVNNVGRFLVRPEMKKIDRKKIVGQLHESLKQKKKRAKKWNYELMSGSKNLKHAPDEILLMLKDWGYDGKHKLNCRWKVVTQAQYGAWQKNEYYKQPCLLFTINNHRDVAIATQIIPVDGKKSQTYYTSNTPKSVYVSIWRTRTRYIAEGVKTAIAAGALFGCKVTPCLDANYLSKHKKPVDKIFADKDSNNIGYLSALKYCKKKNQDPSIIILPDMDIPKDDKGVDFYDQLQVNRASKSNARNK